MAKYAKRADGRYVANRIIDGKRKVFYGRTCKEIDEKIQAFFMQEEEGPFFQVTADQWWSDKEDEITESTRVVYRYAYERLKKAFHGVRIGTIKTKHIQKYISDFARKGYRKSTVSIELGVIKQIFSYAVSVGDLEISPAAEAKLPKKLPTTTRSALTAEQEKKVMACRTGEWWLLGQMLLFTGLRRGELMALHWEDIDRKQKLIHVTKKINYAGNNTGVLEHHLKSENGARDVRLFGQLDRMLPRGRIGLIFSQNGTHLTQAALRKGWAEFCQEAGLADQKGTPLITPHQMRHSFATLCFEAGVPKETAAGWLGDTVEILEKVYQELRPKKEQEGAQIMEEYLDRLAAES